MKNYQLIIILCFGLFLISEAGKYILDTNTLIYNSLSEKLSYEQAEQIFSNARKWQFIGYGITPIFLLIKLSILSLILDFGLFLFDKKLEFKKLFSLVVKSEFIFLAVALIKVLWLYFFQQDYTLEDLQYFYPLSLLHFVGYQGLDVWWIYPFQVINVFELVYWIVLASLLDKALKTHKNKHTGIQIVACSYGIALLLYGLSV